MVFKSYGGSYYASREPSPRKAVKKVRQEGQVIAAL